MEAASSICMQVLLGVFNEKAEGFPECFVRLGAKGTIPEELASRLASAARLRNLLFHRY
ncbi:MAG: HepT-like ribonuclease domain-containing protein [Candidatus Bathyarchaeia archaeon]